MLVKEIFNFQDGRIVFVGEIAGENSFIKSCVCGLFADNKLLYKIHIEGEMIANDSQTKLRSLSTTDKINTANIPYHEKIVLLKCEH